MDDQIIVGNTNVQNNSMYFNDKFSFADKITFESEKFKNEEIMNFNQYLNTEPENETINNENISVYSKKIIKNQNSIKKKEESSFTSEKQVNESVMSDKTMQSYQFSIQETLHNSNLRNENNISNRHDNDNHYLHIIEYKLQQNDKNNTKKSNFNTHNLNLEKTRNEMQTNLESITLNNNSYQNSLNNSKMNTLNTLKKETNTSDKSKIPPNSNSINTSSTIPKKNNLIGNSSGNTKIKISNRNFDSNKNDLNKFLSKKDVNLIKIKQGSKQKEIKNFILKKQAKVINKSVLNTTRDEGENNVNKKNLTNSKSTDKKNNISASNDNKIEKQPIGVVDKALNKNIFKHVKTSSVSSVKNFKNNDSLIKHELT